MDVLKWLFKVIICWPVKGLFWLVSLPFRDDGARPAGLTHGSARWSTRIEQLWHGAVRGHGIVLGRGAFGRLVRFSKDGLVMVFAATGAGKGLGVVIPTLLTYRGSMVVTDPKGENYAITRRHRATLGKVYMLSPTDLLQSERFNPLDIVRAGTPSEADDAQALASLMVMPDSDRDKHWDTKAISLLKAFILHTLHEPPASRNLATVRRLSVGAAETFIATVQDIAANSPSVAARETAAGTLTSSVDRDGNFSDEFSSILSNLQKATEPWSKGAPAGTLSAGSTFRLADLTSGIATLYLCVDEDVLDVYGPWLRVMVGCILKTMTRAKQARPRHKVVLLLDEVAVLGRLDTLEKQSGLLRAYCTPVLIWQNLPQIHKVYRDDALAFLANASARVFFGVNDNVTAEYVATMVGNTTSLSTSSGISQSGYAASQINRQQGQAESGYWLLDPSEVQRLPLHRAVIKMRHVPFAIFARRIDYRKILHWRWRWDAWMNGAPSDFANPPVKAVAPAPPSSAPAPPPPAMLGYRDGSASSAS